MVVKERKNCDLNSLPLSNNALPLWCNLEFTAMAKKSKEEMALINKDVDRLARLILKKGGTSYRRFLELSKRELIVANLDMVTPEEKAQFKHLVLE